MMTDRQKLLLVAGAGVGAFLLFGGASTAKAAIAAPPPPPDPCTTPTDCATLTTCATPILAKATAADLGTLNALLSKAKLLGCTDLATQIQKTIAKVTTVVPAKPTTTTFDPAKAKDPVRANALAIAIGNSKVPAGAPPTIKIASDGSYATFADFCKDAGRVGAVPTIMALQDAAGIAADGVCGTQTDAAWHYYLTHSSRPDGSVDVRVAGELSAACGHEASVAGCAACAGKPKTADVGAIAIPKNEIGPYTTGPVYALGRTAKWDRAMGSGLGAGGAQNRASAAFGHARLFWPHAG